MKPVLGLALGVAIIGAAWFYIAKNLAKDVVSLPYGFGKPTPDAVEMNIAVSMFLPRKDPPKLKDGIVQWDPWVAEHFVLHGPEGARVPLQRTNFSNVMSDRQSGGTPEFWLKATLKPGERYTLTFTPIVPEPVFQQVFSAPTEATEPDRFVFESDD